MNDEQMQPLLEGWFTHREVTPDDVRLSTSRVMARLPGVRQRGRWWPLPAFHRPVSTFPGRGPVPAPIPVTNGRTRPRGSTMFSALKFMVAGVVVALFGGFLLTGVLITPRSDVLPAAATASPSPTTNTDILPGVTLDVEEVEPGVYRVTGDGVRDLASVERQDIVAGYDGGIWLLREDGFLRLGSHGSHAWPTGSGLEDHVFEVAPDGTMWVIPDERRGAGLRSTDGEAWTVQPCPQEDCAGLTVTPDGTVWASWREDDGRWRVGHLGPTGWQPLDGYARSAWGSGSGPVYIAYDRLFLTDAGDLYGAECWANVERGCYLHRYGDGDWTGQDAPGSGYLGFGKVLDVGSDGTVGMIGEFPDLVLSRFADGEWAEWSAADLPDVGLGLDYQFEVAPDGSLWSSVWRSADGSDVSPGEAWWDEHMAAYEEGLPAVSWWDEQMAAVEEGRLVCDGIARFDGVTLDRFLPGRCLSMDIAADGSVWALAADDAAAVPEEGGFPDDQAWGLYVITPEAVAAAE